MWLRLSSSCARTACAALLLSIGLPGCREDKIASAQLADDATTAASPALSESFPLTLTDKLGRKVELRAEPRRIIALLPSHTETLFALGVGDKLLAVDDYSDEPAAAKRLPRLGGLYDTHLEVALSLQPDLVLISDSNAALGPLARAGVPTWAGSAATFDEVFPVIADVGRMVGRAHAAKLLIDGMQGEIAAIEESARKHPKVSVYYELDATPYAIGPDSFVGVMLAKVGGLNIVPSELGAFPKINPELVVSTNPSVIIGPSWEQVARRPGWAKIEAVQKHRVFALSESDSHLIVRPGPRLPEAMRLLATILHGEL
jgi:iron complex transport system substrate-binding protein